MNCTGYRFYRPSIPLQRYVRYYWVLKTHHRVGALTFPIGCQQIIFHRKSPLYIPELNTCQAQSVISGQVNFPSRLETSGELHMIVAVFYPHAFQSIFGIPASELYNMEVSACDIGNVSFNELSLRVIEFDSDIESIRLIEDWLSRQVGKLRNNVNFSRIETSLRLLMESPNLSVAELSSVACLGEKQFNRVFTSTVGMQPKEYARIVRFQKSLWYLQQGNRNFSDVAFASGYSDQSHFIRECRRFSSHTPLELLKNNQVYSDLFTCQI